MRTRISAVALICLAVATEAAPVRAADRVEPVSPAACARMRVADTLHDGARVDCARLSAVVFSFVGFDGAMHDDGRLVVLDAVAPDVLAIVAELRARRFPLRSARPMEEFGGDDDHSMAADNTSAFSDRAVAGTRSVSVHAFGCAIDINPVENPYVTRTGGRSTAEPPAGSPFVTRTPLRPGMAESVVAVFARHGFTVWGGRWHTAADFQHFQVERALAARLAALPAAQARAAFVAHNARGH